MHLKPDVEPTEHTLDTTTPRQEAFGAQHEPTPQVVSSPRLVGLALVEGQPSLSSSSPDHQAKPSGTSVNTDVLLPIIIFAVVKANPVQLVSQLLFIERYRSRRVGGEESFCLINFLAVVEFLGL